MKVLCLPLSIAEVERVFSVLAIIKDKKRNRMKLPLTNVLIQIRCSLKRMNTNCFKIEIPGEVCSLIGKTEVYQDEERNPVPIDEIEGEDELLSEYFIRF